MAPQKSSSLVQATRHDVERRWSVKSAGWIRTSIVVIGLVTLVTTSGCVRRRMTIRSTPEGAMAYVDDQEIGVTPVSTPFTFYGTRKLHLEKDGYESQTIKQPIPAPWYQVTPIDFFAENLWPFEIRDERIVDVTMQPMQIVPNEKLIERGQALRSNAAAGIITSVPNTTINAPPTR